MRAKLISSLEKCFLDEDFNSKKEYKKSSMLKNELFHFQICYSSSAEEQGTKFYYLTVETELANYINISRVENVPVQYAVNPANVDEAYLRTAPGLYPDVLQPLEENGRLIVTNHLKSLMIEIEPDSTVKAGIYPITFYFIEDSQEKNQIRLTFEIEIIDNFLPQQELKYTQWFYCDSLMDYYETEAFDDRHFKIIENFAREAVKYGANILLTPVFTPPLDTYIGGERKTMQLVSIKKDNGNYSFDFALLGKWVDMCNRIGIKYFEIPHFFTQWGAKAAPKFMATVDGEYKRIFGWETDSQSKEYAEFLKVFIKELLSYMKKLDNADGRCIFHISDEPQSTDIESYLAAKSIVAPLLDGYYITDAISNFDFYASGISEHPIPANNAAETFINNGVRDLWTYYCNGCDREVSNRYISMPSYRNRIIGLQLYKYNISGFLHWGYNFYYNQFSYAFVNPFMNTCGDYFGPAGDAFSVYPGPEGVPWASLRMIVFSDALQDIRAFKLCEQLYGKDLVMSILENEIEPITFKNYPHSSEYLLKIREAVNRKIKEKCN